MDDGIDSPALRYFLEVARCGLLTAAAEKQHVSVTALRRQVALPEKRMGVRLFERRPRGMVLSEAGQALLCYARKSSLEAERILLDIGGADPDRRLGGSATGT